MAMCYLLILVQIIINILSVETVIFFDDLITCSWLL